MDTPLRERVIESTHNLLSTPEVDIVVELIDQEASKRVVEALEGLKVAYQLKAHEIYKLRGKSRRRVDFDVDIDAAIKQVKGSTNE